MSGRAGRAGIWLLIGLLGAASAPGQDRVEELEELRGRIRDSRERVTGHEAEERELLEALESVDRRLIDIRRDRDVARQASRSAQDRVVALEPQVTRAEADLAQTRRSLGARAVALYRGGELGAVRVLFSAGSLSEMLSRANALRVILRHDATLVARQGAERDRLEVVRGQAASALEEQREADQVLGRLALQVGRERQSKRALLRDTREDRTAERQLLLELEQAAQALEETIRTLGANASSGGVAGGFARRRGQLAPPVDAGVEGPFGRVVDPEFQTKTFRNGVDFAAEAGVQVRSVALGVVRFAGWFRGYGRIVIVDHGDGYHSVSGHLDEIFVEVGDRVVEGAAIGTVGETGSLGGPSLYFELREAGTPVDPVPWILDPRA